MKNDRISIQEERRKQKGQQHRKRKLEKQKERLERLAKQNPARLERKIADFTKKGHLAPHEQNQFNDLKRELDDIVRAKKKLGIEYTPRDYTKQRINKKSIYYDQDLNPSGDPPPGLPYREFGHGHHSDDDEGYSTSESVKAIPMPSARGNNLSSNNAKASEKEEAPAITTYESQPVIRDFQKESTAFKPTVLSRKRQRTASNGAKASFLENQNTDSIEPAPVGPSRPLAEDSGDLPEPEDFGDLPEPDDFGDLPEPEDFGDLPEPTDSESESDAGQDPNAHGDSYGSRQPKLEDANEN